MPEKILLTETGILPKLIQDYLNKKVDLEPFYNRYPSIENFKHQIAQKKISSEKRKVLVEVLLKQYADFETSELVKHNIQLLLKENTFTVTTAHQPNIFTGPLYFIYKILQAIQLANALKKQYTENHFVPFYWMGCEDHDFEEINHIHLNDETLTWQDYQGGATGRYNTDSLQELITTIKEKLQHEPFANEVLPIFEKAYKDHNTLTTATQYLVNELMGQYGLIVINQDNATLKQQFSSVIKNELIKHETFTQAKKQTDKLHSLGYTPQAFARELNLFYLGKNFRERIIYHSESDIYSVLNTDLKFSKNEIISLVETNPEVFSPNVFLRPLYQEIILPNLAYIGGSGELSYWLQQKAIFDSNETVFPILVHRNAFTLIEPSTQKKIDKLGLPVSIFWKEENEIVKNYILQNVSLPDFNEEKETLRSVFETLKQKAGNIDTTLIANVEAQLQQAHNNIDGLEKKILKALKNKEEQSIAQIKSVKQKITPNNMLQERYDNVLLYYCRYGLQLNNNLLNNINSIEANMNIIAVN